MEEISDVLNKEKVLEKLRFKLKKLGVDETNKEEFNKKYEYYKENWRELVENE